MKLHCGKSPQARRLSKRRAFSLVELLAVVAIIGLIVLASVGRFGGETLENMRGDAYVRRLALDLTHARRRTIATGDNHYLAVAATGGQVTSYSLTQRASGGDAIVDEPRPTPTGVTVTASHTALEFDFDGSALGGYVVTVQSPARSWTVSTVAATGAVNVVETTP